MREGLERSDGSFSNRFQRDAEGNEHANRQSFVAEVLCRHCIATSPALPDALGVGGREEERAMTQKGVTPQFGTCFTSSCYC